jgi:alkylation response protein AidB-like acyl-CoA dehydrogenase
VEHGSDLISCDEQIFAKSDVRWNVRARQDGTEWVINGQKAAWVSGGTIANCALLFAEVDASKGISGGGVFFCPLDIPGVTKGKPLEKMGQRDLNQGEIFFDNARIPGDYLLFGADMLMFLHSAILSNANAIMGNIATGLARAAFEEALNYAKVRVQGGKPIIEHNSVKQRLAEMFTKVETCRALSRAVRAYNSAPPNGIPFLEYSVASKITCTRLALEVADEAIQLFGGNGVCREYLPEKLFRDARASLIEDGNNEILAMAAGKTISESYPRSR